MNLEKEKYYTFGSHNPNNLHKQNPIYTQFCLKYASVDHSKGNSMFFFSQPCHFLFSLHVDSYHVHLTTRSLFCANPRFSCAIYTFRTWVPY